MTSATATARSQAVVSSPEGKVERFYRPELDILRFVAFLSVFVFHGLIFVPSTELLSQTCRLGMCLFFFLSAYLITELLLKEKAKTGRIHLKAFYIRRILRIWPLYFFALLLAYGLGRIFPSNRIPLMAVAWYSLLAGNWWNILVIHGPLQSCFSPLWIISLEEQFYLIWPFLALGGRRTLLAGSAATFVVAACTLAWATSRGLSPLSSEIWSNSLFQFAFFGLGGITSLIVKGSKPDLAKPFRYMLAIGAAISFFCAGELFMLNKQNEFISSLLAYGAVGIGCLALFFSLLGMPPSRLGQPFASLGRISYGLYVFHLPAIYLCSTLLSRSALLQSHMLWIRLGSMGMGFALCLGLAKLSFRFIETPFLVIKKRYELIATRPTS